MSKRTIYCEQDPLGDRLKREALNDRPAFSEAIHERIVAALAIGDQETGADSHRSRSITSSPAIRLKSSARWAASRWSDGAIHSRSSGRVVAAISAVCASFVLLTVGGWYAWHVVSNSNPSQSLAIRSVAVGEGTPVAGAKGLTEPSDSFPAATSDTAKDWRLLASLDKPRQSAGPSPNQLVYEDARRAARVLFDRLPVDLKLTDLALCDD